MSHIRLCHGARVPRLNATAVKYSNVCLPQQQQQKQVTELKLVFFSKLITIVIAKCIIKAWSLPIST